MSVPAKVVEHMLDQRWRLSNLYWITDKEGRRIRFEPNWAQLGLLDSLHYLNLVLKARQLGFTTFIQLYMLDVCIFHPDTRAGVIAHTKDDAEAIFRDKVKFPYDNLPEGIKAASPIKRDNTTTLEMANNSIIRVGTSLRGGTLQYLHISEYGKICARYPEKAREIATGALNTIQAGQMAFIESTAEGQEGRFYEMCQTAKAKANKREPLTSLDWKFHFYPWWREPAYTIDPEGVIIAPSLAQYFRELAGKGIVTTAGQQAWYAKKLETQLADMKREFPSTPEEAFAASIEGAYYAEQIANAELDGRIGVFPAHEDLPVHTAWDIGIGDANSIWFFQVALTTVRVVGYYENSGEGMLHYVAKTLEMAGANGWVLGNHYLPHDAKMREYASGRTRIEQFLAHLPTARLVPMHKVDDGINAARTVFAKCQFDEGPCTEGLRTLRNYRKVWNEDRGCWGDQPRHDWASHGADSFRYLAVAHQEIRPEPIKKPVEARGIVDATFNDLMRMRPVVSDRI